VRVGELQCSRYSSTGSANVMYLPGPGGSLLRRPKSPLPPLAIVMNCRPSTSYTAGTPSVAASSSYFHSTSPVSRSYARTARSDAPLPAARDRNDLPAADLAYRRNALGRPVELVLPQHLARIAVVRPESSVRRRADEQQAAGRRDRTAARRVAAGARDALRGEGADLAVRDLPFDHALVEVV